MDLTPQNLSDIASAVVNRAVGKDSDGTDLLLGETANRSNWVYQQLLAAGSIKQQLTRIENLAATPFDIDQLAAAIVAKLPVGTLTNADVQEACDAAIRARFADVDGA